MLTNTFVTIKQNTFRLEGDGLTTHGLNLKDFREHKTHIDIFYRPFMTKAKILKLAENNNWDSLNICDMTNSQLDEHCLEQIKDIDNRVFINVDTELAPSLKMVDVISQGKLIRSNVFMGCKNIGQDDCVTGYLMPNGIFYVSSLIWDDMQRNQKYCKSFSIRDCEQRFGIFVYEVSYKH